MEGGLFLGGSVVAALVAGSLALFAPCCVSVMLPAYFAAGFHNRRRLVAMTFIFAAGVATVILPIAMGAVAFRQLFAAQHSTIYVIGGTLMLALAAYLLLGGQIHLPMPGRRAGNKTGPVAVYSLGVFSGVASSCCAPVLAGVIALSGIASSFGYALLLGVVYVFGMVAPLFVISLLWERRDWRSSRLFQPRTFTLRLGSIVRKVSGTNILSGALLAIMGSWSVFNGLNNSTMPGLSGWQAWFSLKLQAIGRTFKNIFDWMPNWTATLLLLALVVFLARRALRPSDTQQFTPEIPKEVCHEHQNA